MRHALGLAVLWGGLGLAHAFGPQPAAGAAVTAQDDSPAWSYTLSAGYDTFVHIFPLAENDTTETISEWTFVLSAEGGSRRRSRHHWRLRPELWLGTELLREGLGFSYQLRPDSSRTTFRLDAAWQGRQYLGGSAYALTSDSSEGRLKARWYLSSAGRTATELRLLAGLMRYRTPSTLELNHQEIGGAITLRAGQGTHQRAAIGARLVQRAYPDSAAIDRTSLAVNGQYDRSSPAGGGVRFYHRTERRLIAEDQVRPSAWTHWSDASWRRSAGPGQLITELQSEIWNYDNETAIFSDSWRLEGSFAYRWGNLLGTGWKLGVTGENLSAGEAAEAYRQLGILAGIDTFSEDLSGSLNVEFGHRDYRHEGADLASEVADLSDLTDLSELGYYSDFHYWEIFLMASYALAAQVSLDVMAHYQPESHTEQNDDAAVGFASVRLIWLR